MNYIKELPSNLFYGTKDFLGEKTSSLAKDAGYWTVAGNNKDAFIQVYNDEYQYNNAEPSITMKTKQMGTEILHGSLKWGTIGMVLDKVFFSHIWEPKPGDLRYTYHHISLPSYVSNTFNDVIVPLFGIGSAIGSGIYFVKELREAGSLLLDGKVIVKDFAGERSLSGKNLTKLMEKIFNAAVTLPVFIGFSGVKGYFAFDGLRHGRLTGGAKASPFLLATQAPSWVKVSSVTAGIGYSVFKLLGYLYR